MSKKNFIKSFNHAIRANKNFFPIIFGARYHSYVYNKFRINWYIFIFYFILRLLFSFSRIEKAVIFFLFRILYYLPRNFLIIPYNLYILKLSLFWHINFIYSKIRFQKFCIYFPVFLRISNFVLHYKSPFLIHNWIVFRKGRGKKEEWHNKCIETINLIGLPPQTLP